MGSMAVRGSSNTAPSTGTALSGAVAQASGSGRMPSLDGNASKLSFVTRSAGAFHMLRFFGRRTVFTSHQSDPKLLEREGHNQNLRLRIA